MANCGVCGEPMPEGEEMFNYHGSSGPCPKPALPRDPIKLKLANPEHEVAYQEIVQLVDKHAGKLSALEMLAVASNMLGKLVGMQDQRTITPTMAMEVVAQNIEHGNKQLLDQLAGSKLPA